jgi:hypothetical protein
VANGTGRTLKFLKQIELSSWPNSEAVLHKTMLDAYSMNLLFKD